MRRLIKEKSKTKRQAEYRKERLTSSLTVTQEHRDIIRAGTTTTKHQPSDFSPLLANSQWLSVPQLGLCSTSNSSRHTLHHFIINPRRNLLDLQTILPGTKLSRLFLKQPNRKIFPGFLFPALGGLLFGYDIGATSGATISLQSPELSGTAWFNLSAVLLGLVVSGSLYGALFGSLLVYPIADFLGRRRELIISAVLYLLGGLITAYAPSLSVLLVGRLLYGLGIGMAMHGAPLYIAETCPSQIRGTLVSLKELLIVLGILLGYFVGSFEINAIGGWRYMYGISAPIALLMGIGVWLLPPSPRWLLLRAAQGKGSVKEYKEKAVLALSKLRGRPPGDKVSEKQIEETYVSLKSAYADQESEGSLLEVFQGPNLKAFIIAVGLVLFQQITGQPSVLYYAGPILQTAGFSAASDATRVSVVIGLFKFVMTGIAVLKVDELGRRPLLIVGVSGLALSLFLLSAYFKFLGGFPLVAVASLLLYVGCYQISFGPISWLMVSEIFPLRTRGKGISLAVLANFASNAIVTFAFSPLKEALGAENLFILFGVIALLSLLFVVLLVPETKGLSLEEIESKLSK
ncbi:Major facilitator superfamily protein [Prunus dulcis]|uniref:Major facilitator superfamily protein n=1 Tax=Prunus dulcis TaxID=3755 RepID=A0A4Y1RKX0_PRUDU|nr:Major facilitator superfamily protein [Prunus dulcis]